MPARLLLLLAAGFAILAGVAAWAITRRAPHEVVYIRMPQAEGLREQRRVTYLGVEIGAIGRISLARDSSGTPWVDLAIHLLRRDASIRAGDSVSVRTQGLLGDRELVILPGPADAPELGHGDTLQPPVARTVQFPTTPEGLDSALVRILRDSGRARSNPPVPK